VKGFLNDASKEESNVVMSAPPSPAKTNVVAGNGWAQVSMNGYSRKKLNREKIQ
jgi:hypothetical protein